MAVLEIGRVCLKIAGREAGKYAVVVKPAGKSKDEKSFVFVTGPRLLTGVKRRKCNIDHLKATEYKLEIAEDAPDEQVITAYEKAGLIIKLGLKKPSAAQLKAKAEKKTEKEKKKTETAKKQKKGKDDKKKEKK
jgi:large subunit ribosomal protein L14e